MLNSLPFLPLYSSSRWEGAPLSTLPLKPQLLFSFKVGPGLQQHFAVTPSLILVGAWCQKKSWTRAPLCHFGCEKGPYFQVKTEKIQGSSFIFNIKYFTLDGKYWCTVLLPSLSIIFALCHWEPIPSHWLVQLFARLLCRWQWKPNLGSETGRGGGLVFVELFLSWVSSFIAVTEQPHLHLCWQSWGNGVYWDCHQEFVSWNHSLCQEGRGCQHTTSTWCNEANIRSLSMNRD